MALLRMPAIEGLYYVLETCRDALEQWASNRCPTCGYPSGDLDTLHAMSKQAAVLAKTCQVVLDRTELGPRATLEVKQVDGDLDLKLLTDQERERMMVALTEFERVKGDVRRRLMGTQSPMDPDGKTITVTH